MTKASIANSKVKCGNKNYNWLKLIKYLLNIHEMIFLMKNC